MLRAVDTNVLVRALTDDGSEQAAKASAFLRDESVYISISVLLETEWVLRSSLQFKKSDVEGVLRMLASLPNVTLEEPRRMLDTLAAYGDGLDFADALHLYSAEGCSNLVTYDRSFARRAARLMGTVTVQEL